MQNKEKEIIRKLLQDNLSQEEKDDLLNSRQVNNYLLNQWDELEEVILSDRPDKDVLWEYIRKRSIDKPQVKKTSYYNFFRAIAAVAILIIGVTSFFYIQFIRNGNKPQIVYIVNTGVRCMDSVVLSDSSKIIVGPNSRLTYPEKFNGNNREITLDGQAFFNITKDKNSPFIVHTAQMDITVLGTSFEIYNYGTDSIVETILVSGSIRVVLPNLKDTITISKNKKITYNKISNAVKVEPIDADKYSSWRKQGNLSFENENLTTIMPRLKQWFGTEIDYNNIDTDSYRFTFKIKDESLEQILFIIGKSSPIKYQRKGGGYRLYKTN